MGACKTSQPQPVEPPRYLYKSIGVEDEKKEKPDFVIATTVWYIRYSGRYWRIRYKSGPTKIIDNEEETYDPLSRAQKIVLLRNGLFEFSNIPNTTCVCSHKFIDHLDGIGLGELSRR